MTSKRKMLQIEIISQEGEHMGRTDIGHSRTFTDIHGHSWTFMDIHGHVLEFK